MGYTPWALTKMKKEVLVAIIVGFTIGLIVVFGVITANTSLKQQSQKNNPASTENSPAVNLTPTGPQQTKHKISISEPKDLSISGNEEIVIKGTTTPKSRVVITDETSEYIIEVNDSGVFSQKITLVSGENEIKLVSFSPNLDTTEAAITVVYTTAEF